MTTAIRRAPRWSLLICFILIIGSMVAMKFLLPEWVDLLKEVLPWGVCFVIEAIMPFLVVFILLFIGSGWLQLNHLRVSIGVFKFRPSYILMGVLMVLASQMVVAPLFWLFPNVPWLQGTDQLLLAMQSGFFPMLVMIIIFPVLHQILFRGIMFSALRRGFGLWWGVLLVSLLCGWSFAVPQMMVTGFTASFVYCAIYSLSGSMLSIILMNMIANGISYLGFLILGSEDYTREYIASNETLSVALWTVSAVALIVLGWQMSLVGREPKKKRKKPMEK